MTARSCSSARPALDPWSVSPSDGQDDEATRIICDVARRLHTPRGAPPPGLVPLTTWFEPLAPMAQAQGGILVQAANAAADVLASQREIVPLHADLHHENVLDFGERGWLAIDPKRVIGERTFEYTILFCDPDLGLPHLTIARRPEIFAQRLEIVSEAANLEVRRLLLWILAWAGLSAVWQIGDDLDPGIELQVAEMALAVLPERLTGRGSPGFAGIRKLHQLTADPTQGLIKGRRPLAGSFGSKSPSLPAGEPSLHEPSSLDGQIGQLLIRQTIQELVDLGPRCLCAQRAQRHRLGAGALPPARLRRGRLGGPAWRVAEVPRTGLLVAHREPGFAPCRLQSCLVPLTILGRAARPINRAGEARRAVQHQHPPSPRWSHRAAAHSPVPKSFRVHA